MVLADIRACTGFLAVLAWFMLIIGACLEQLTLSCGSQAFNIFYILLMCLIECRSEKALKCVHLGASWVWSVLLFVQVHRWQEGAERLAVLHPHIWVWPAAVLLPVAPVPVHSLNH